MLGDVDKCLVVDKSRYSDNKVLSQRHACTSNTTDTDIQPPPANFTEQAGPKVPFSCETPQDCFSLFFDDNLLQYIADQYAQKKVAS